MLSIVRRPNIFFNDWALWVSLPCVLAKILFFQCDFVKLGFYSFMSCRHCPKPINCSGVFKFLAEAYIYSYHQQKSSVELRSTRRNIDFGKHLVLKQTLLRCLSKLFTFHCRLFLMIQLGEMLVSRNGEETEKITAKPLFSTRFIKIKFDKLQTFVADYH